MTESVVITGTAMVSSLGGTAGETYQALLSGRQGIRPIRGFDASGFDCRVAAQVEGPDPSELGIHPRDARIMGKHSHMLMKCAREAFLESGLNAASISGEDIGLFAGIGMVDYEVAALLPSVIKSRDRDGRLDYDRFFTEGYREIYPLWLLSMLHNIPVCQVGADLGIRGMNAVFSPHADAGAQAIGEGVKAIDEQEAKVVLVGGVSETVNPLSLARGQFFKILNTSEPPDKMTCRPFSRKRMGAILGEGCGVIVLEPRSSAISRGARFSAAISGFGSACRREEEGAPTAAAISRAMNEAMVDAGLEPSDIDLVIAHGDGVPSGDGNEIKAINELFSTAPEKTLVFSSKGALGTLHAGATVVDTILAVQMFADCMVPPTVNVHPVDEAVRFNLVHEGAIKKTLSRILINSRSHEGQCVSLIIEACD